LAQFFLWLGMLAALNGICRAADGVDSGYTPAATEVLPATRIIEAGSARLVIDIWGEEGETLIALPGLGADSSDFRYIAPILVAAGYRFIGVNQRGIRGSTGKLEDLTLQDYAGDIVNLLDALGLEQAHLLGWALGNRITRLVGARYPDRVAGIILLAAGGRVNPAADIIRLTNTLFTDPGRPEQETFSMLRQTLFSAAAEEAVLRDYLLNRKEWPAARTAQLTATRATPLETWWSGGEGPLLIVQGLDDQMAPVANGRAMQAAFADRVELVELQDAAHLMAFEQPQATAGAIIAFLDRYRALEKTRSLP
jgi:pimeloyl-ACP methyl ester carboxylesterase